MSKKDIPSDDRGSQPVTVAVVDDEPDIRALVSLHLRRAGFEVQEFGTGGEFTEWLSDNCPDLVVLDLMLPDIEGTEICKDLRSSSEYAGVPIIMLTALGHEADRVLGLELGADDYVTKPFSPRELVARVRAVLRRSSTKETSSHLHSGSIVLDTERFELKVGGKQVDLTPTEFRILTILVRGNGRVYSRSQILEELWQGEKFIFDRTVDVHISNIRSKLGEQGKRIRNVRGIGYRLEV